MKYIRLLLFALLIAPFLVISQVTKKDTIPDKPQRAAFRSSYIIDNPTNVLYTRNSMEMQIKHRFGLINSGVNDYAGIFGASNIRLGLSYAVHDRWTLGFGITKFNLLQDFNLKVGILRQTRSDKVPFSVSYYGNFVIDTRDKEHFEYDQDRFSYFHQIIFARRFSPDFSLQIAPSISHYNFVDYGLKNDVYGVAVGGRHKISRQGSILVEYSHPFTNHPINEGVDVNPKPGFSIGVEFATIGHAFQLIISNYNGIVPQKNYVFNQNDFFKGDFLIGFNITRVYKF